MPVRHREILVGFAAGIAFVIGACATGERIQASGQEDDGSGGRAGSRDAGGNGEPNAAGGAGEPGVHEAGGSSGTPGSVAGSVGSGGRAVGGGGTPASGGAPNDGDADAGAMASGGSSGGGAGGGGVTANQTLFSDDFEGSAKSWISVPSDGWSVVSEDTKVFRQGTLDTQFRVSSIGDPEWTDQTVEARVKVLAFTGSSTSYFAGVFARFKDLDNHYFVALQSDRHVKIKKKSGGSSTSVSSQADATVEPGTWYSVKLTVKGTTLTAYLDGKQVATANDSDIPSGGIAVGTKNATAEFDDMKVTTP